MGSKPTKVGSKPTEVESSPPLPKEVKKATVCNETSERFCVLIFMHSDRVYKAPSEKRLVGPGQKIDIYGMAADGAVKIAVVRNKKASDISYVHGDALKDDDALVCDLFCVDLTCTLTIKSISSDDKVIYETDSNNGGKREEGKILYLSQKDGVVEPLGTEDQSSNSTGKSSNSTGKSSNSTGKSSNSTGKSSRFGFGNLNNALSAAEHASAIAANVAEIAQS